MNENMRMSIVCVRVFYHWPITENNYILIMLTEIDLGHL